MIAIVKYNAGNIGSVTNALNRLGVENKVTDNPDELRAADKVVFPGVGEASTAMKYLKERGLDKVIKNLKQPVLGICLGMQLMCAHSEEGDVDCLGIFDTVVKKFPNLPAPLKGESIHEGQKQLQHFKVPHMGWNGIGAIRTRKHKSVEQLVDETKLSFPPLGGARRVGGLARPHHTSTKREYADKREYAGDLRKNMTESEVILWSQIKSEQRGAKFSRQKPVGGFIPDYVCYDLKLIIEVDGLIHLSQKEEDQRRQEYLESLGYRVLRFQNPQIKNDLSYVLNLIDKAVDKRKVEFAKPPYPPRGGKVHGDGLNRPDFTSRSSPDQKQEITVFPDNTRKSKLLRAIRSTNDVYYVHSFYAVPNESAVAVCNYILTFASVMQRDNFYATQFHPEKSAAVGEQILENFLNL